MEGVVWVVVVEELMKFEFWYCVRPLIVQVLCETTDCRGIV